MAPNDSFLPPSPDPAGASQAPKSVKVRGQPEVVPVSQPILKPPFPLPPWMMPLAGVLAVAGLLLLVARFGHEQVTRSRFQTVVQGIVQNEAAEPLVDAAIYARANPAMIARTDATGAFVLPGVPPGDQTLIVVVHGMAQHFEITVPSAEECDIGILTYRAAP